MRKPIGQSVMKHVAVDWYRYGRPAAFKKHDA
jgi:hypothetical protein